MPSPSAIGSQIRILYQTNFPTFTPNQVSKILREKDYTFGQSTYHDSQNPRLSQITFPMFSKDNLSIYINASQNAIGFMILNTVNLDEVYEEITTILSSLNIVSEVISNISFSLITRYNVDHNPQTQMTALLKTEFVEGLTSALDERLSLSSINLTTSFSSEEGLTVAFEPLISSPENHYFVSISYQTTEWDSFQSFIEKYRNEILSLIFGEVEKIA